MPEFNDSDILREYLGEPQKDVMKEMKKEFNQGQINKDSKEKTVPKKETFLKSKIKRS